MTRATRLGCYDALSYTLAISVSVTTYVWALVALVGA